MNDDDDMVTPAAAEVPVRSESQTGSRKVGERGGDEADFEEWLAPAIEEAGYGYGV